MKFSHFIPLLFLIGFLSSCACDDQHGKKHTGGIHIKDLDPEAKVPQVALKIVRLDQQLIKVKSVEELRAFDKQYPFYVKKYIDVRDDSSKQILLQQMYQLYTNTAMQEFFAVTQKQYADLSVLEKQLAEMFSYMKYYFPEFKVPTVYTTVSTVNDLDIYLDEEVLIINLGMRLGKNVAPQYRVKVTEMMPQYIIDRLGPEYTVPTVCQGYARIYAASNEKEKRMIEAMIYFGKLHYFTERMLPDMQDSLNIMYTQAQVEDVEKNSYTIYAHFVDKKLFYINEKFIVEKYTGERPKVQEIGDKCPGRIGRWLGWMIVREYMKEHPEITLQQLMAEKDAQKIFKQSKYKPMK